MNYVPVTEVKVGDTIAPFNVKPYKVTVIEIEEGLNGDDYIITFPNFGKNGVRKKGIAFCLVRGSHVPVVKVV
jgi:hypothetical protein